jgi:hypothetical protein
MLHPAIAVFTGQSIDQILQDGGSSPWLLNRHHAKRQIYIVCVRNTKYADFPGPEPHKQAFLIGKIKGLRPIGRAGAFQRWFIEISEYARVSYPNAWDGRNPVRYTTLEEMGIDPSELTFTLLEATPQILSERDNPGIQPLTIEQAKQGLSAHFGVAPDAIEIILRS